MSNCSWHRENNAVWTLLARKKYENVESQSVLIQTICNKNTFQTVHTKEGMVEGKNEV